MCVDVIVFSKAKFPSDSVGLKVFHWCFYLPATAQPTLMFKQVPLNVGHTRGAGHSLHADEAFFLFCAGPLLCRRGLASSAVAKFCFTRPVQQVREFTANGRFSSLDWF